MKKIITDDGSTTFYNEKYQDIYHSRSGAIEESFGKFAVPALRSRLGDPKIRILDICFGLGYNSAAAIDYILENSAADCAKLDIIGLEIDQEILSKIPDLNPGFKNYDIIKKALDSPYSGSRVRLRIITCDARAFVRKADCCFDVVFLDPFSPSKHPELWTYDLFSDIFRIVSDGGSLHTYSCAGKVRKNLERAGFTVTDGPVVGRRSPSTIAIKR